MTRLEQPAPEGRENRRLVHEFGAWAAIAALVIFFGAPASGEAPAARGAKQPLLAVSAYNAPSYGREIQLVGLDGRRLRIDPHPPLPIDGAWSPNGKRIAFSGGDGPSYAVGYRGIYTTNSRGTEVQLLYAAKQGERHSSFAFVPSWSPDGKWVSFSVDGDGPWVVDAHGQHARRLADLAVDQWATWSPDGRTLAFAGRRSSGNDGVYTVRVDGTRLRRITRNQTRRERNAEAGILHVAWAPDGKHIAVTRYDFGPRWEVDVVDADGRNERRVAWGGCAAWSPDGRLAFEAEDRAGRTVGIGVVRPGHGRPKLIVRHKGAWCPTWTADGHRLLFFTGARGPYVVDADNGTVRKPSAAERRHLRLAPTADQLWSTDGKLLEINGYFDEEWFTVRISTLRGVAATFSWADDHSPTWSPGGTKLAFARTAKKTDAVYVVDATGGAPRKVASGTNPVWSPDGSWIAFERDKKVFVVASDGGPARAIAAGGDPAWSPDSRWVAVAGSGLHVAPRQGGEARQLDEARPDCAGNSAARARTASPAWSHDGRTIAFAYYMEDCEEWTLAVIGSDGTSQRDIGHPNGQQPQWSPDDAHLMFIDSWGRLSYIAKDGQDVRVLDERDAESFSLTSDGNLVAYAIEEAFGSEIWLVQTDGSNRRPLLQSGTDTEPAWRP
jgi:Tol biopolymer transport system component